MILFFRLYGAYDAISDYQGFLQPATEDAGIILNKGGSIKCF